jgi:hypothetical protein
MMNFVELNCADPENPTKKEIFAGIMSLVSATKTIKRARKQENLQEIKEKKSTNVVAPTKEIGKTSELKVGALRSKPDDISKKGNLVQLNEVLRFGIELQNQQPQHQKLNNRMPTNYIIGAKPLYECEQKSWLVNLAQQFESGESSRPLVIRDHLSGKSMDVYHEANHAWFKLPSICINCSV